jgi:hypothetical protein
MTTRKFNFDNPEEGEYERIFDPVHGYGPQHKVRVARFKAYMGPPKKIIMDQATELCGTCKLRWICYYPNKHISVDYCLDYQGEEFTRICGVCRKLTYLNLNTGRCSQCGSLQYNVVLPTKPPK